MTQLCTIVAFDPGETTGWCVMNVLPEHLTDVGCHPDLAACAREIGIATGQIDAKHLGSNDAGLYVNKGHEAMNLDGENMAVTAMLNLAHSIHPKSVVLLERFVLDPKKANSKYDLLSPVRIISAFSYGMYSAWTNPFGNDGNDTRNPLERVYLLNRGDPKRTCTDERLKRWNLDPGGGNANRHARDAIRIAYYFLRDCRGSGLAAREKRWRAWPHLFSDPMASVGRQGGKTPRALGERI